MTAPAAVGARVLRAHPPGELEGWCDRLHAAVEELAKTDPRFRLIDLDTLEDLGGLFTEVAFETAGSPCR